MYGTSAQWCAMLPLMVVNMMGILQNYGLIFMTECSLKGADYKMLAHMTKP